MSEEEKSRGPAELEEARQARALAEALDGRAGATSPPLSPSSVEEEALQVAVAVAACREPELSAEAKARIAGDLFGEADEVAAVRRPDRHRSRWPLALAATVLIGISAALVARERLAADRMRQAEEARARQAAQALVAALLPGDAASRAQAIADGAAP